MLVKANKEHFEFAPFQPAAEVILSTELEHMWAYFFTLGSLAVFCAPVVCSLHLAQEPSVSYWIGKGGFAAIAVPILIIAANCVHVLCGRPRQIPTLLSTIIPGVVLLCVAQNYMSQSGAISQVLLSRDCMTDQQKNAIHYAWKVADQLYDRCVNRTMYEEELPLEQVLSTLRLEQCREYFVSQPDPWGTFRQRWAYLSAMEEQHSCSGWCAAARPLWTHRPTKDACSIVAGSVLEQNVRLHSWRMFSFSLFIVLLSTLAIVWYSNKLHEYGQEWLDRKSVV